MLSKFKRQKHQQHLTKLPKIALLAEQINTLFSPVDYRHTFTQLIEKAQKRIYIVALYLEQDDAGKDILHTIYQAKKANLQLDVAIFVDWHRAQRGRIGEQATCTNADWYREIAAQYPEIDIPIYGVPVNTREVLGVLHLKGSIIDNTLIYSGASINDVYLHKHDKYRYDRYQLIDNQILADSLVNYIKTNLQDPEAVHQLNTENCPTNAEIKKEIRKFRKHLKNVDYQFIANANNEQLAITPLVGLGKESILANTINHLIASTEEKLIICTPYFNFPSIVTRRISRLLFEGKQVEIIVGDKKANDFYIPEDKPFKLIGTVPYLYEIYLRRFVKKLQKYVDNGQLIIRLWKHEDHTYHLKGLWIDKQWHLITGNNLNTRAMLFDLENAILIHDPKNELQQDKQTELENIRHHTTKLTSFQELDTPQAYPEKVKKIIRRLRRIRIDKLINRVL